MITWINMQQVHHQAQQKSETSSPAIWYFFRIALLPKQVKQIYDGDKKIDNNPANAATWQFPPSMHSSFERFSMLCPKTIQGQQNAIQQVPHPPVRDSERENQCDSICQCIKSSQRRSGLDRRSNHRCPSSIVHQWPCFARVTKIPRH